MRFFENELYEFLFALLCAVYLYFFLNYWLNVDLQPSLLQYDSGYESDESDED